MIVHSFGMAIHFEFLRIFHMNNRNGILHIRTIYDVITDIKQTESQWNNVEFK